jgi:hypothetical protein
VGRKLVVVSMLVVVALAACSTAAAIPTAPLKPTQELPNATPLPAVSSTSIATAGQLSDLGKPLFVKSCSCHGSSGQSHSAPLLTGPSATLARFGSAQMLLDFIERHRASGEGGDLRADEYLQIVSFLLVTDGIISTTSAVATAGLAGISLNK